MSSWKRYTMNPEKPFILGSKGQRSRSRGRKKIPAWVFALLWVLASSSSYCHHYYRRHFRGTVFTAVCLSVCLQDNSKNYGCIGLFVKSGE